MISVRVVEVEASLLGKGFPSSSSSSSSSPSPFSFGGSAFGAKMR